MKKKRLLYLLGALLGAVMIPLFFVNLFTTSGCFPGKTANCNVTIITIRSSIIYLR